MTTTGYHVSRHKTTPMAESWGITYGTATGKRIAAGSVTRDVHSGYWDVRTDAGEPCRVGSRGYVARMAAVRAYANPTNPAN